MRKDRNKERRNMTQKQQPAEKRRKIDEGFEESRREGGKTTRGKGWGKEEMKLT